MIRKNGTVRVDQEGTLIERFIFADVDFQEAEKEAIQWAIKRLQANLADLKKNQYNTTNGVQFPDKASPNATESLNKLYELAAAKIKQLEETIRQMREHETSLYARLQAYDRVVCAEPFGVRWAIPEGGTVPSIDPKKVGDVLEDNKRLRADLGSLIKDQNIASAQHLKEIEYQKFKAANQAADRKMLLDALDAERASGEALLANNEKLRAENEHLKECNNNQAKMLLQSYPFNMRFTWSL